jgi:hypothetical protein
MCLKILYQLWVTSPFEYDGKDCNLDNFLLQRAGQTIYIYLVEFGNIRLTNVEGPKSVEKFEKHLYANQQKEDKKLWFQELLKSKRIDLPAVFTVPCKTEVRASVGSSRKADAANEFDDSASRKADVENESEDVYVYETRNLFQYMKDTLTREGTKRAKDLYDCIHEPDTSRDKVQRKRCRTLQKLYGKKYFKYFHALTWRGGRRKRTRRR